jgi:hypothetical protein
LPAPDAAEVHRIEIAAPPEAVYRALWTTDLGASRIVKGLLGLRALPRIVLERRAPDAAKPLTLQSVIDAGFGRLAEEPGRELVLGVTGRFWRPTGNIEPFDRESFSRPVPRGMARAVWNFAVAPTGERGTILSTETRVVCGDAASRRKFRLYWLAVRPFSGLIRSVMLRAVRRSVESTVA